MTALRTVSLLLLAATLLTACETNSRYSRGNNTAQRALLGGAIGAGLGAGIGAATGGTAMSGAGYGAGIGALIGIISE